MAEVFPPPLFSVTWYSPSSSSFSKHSSFIHSKNKEPVKGAVCWESTGNKMCSFSLGASRAGAKGEEAVRAHFGSRGRDPEQLAPFWDPGTPSSLWTIKPFEVPKLSTEVRACHFLSIF